MKLLIYSHDFAPTIGGIQTLVMALAEGLARRPGADFEVTVVTATPAPAGSGAQLPFRVVRRPSASALLRLLRQSDVVHLAGPAMLPLLLALLLRKPLVLEHHGFQAICPNGQFFFAPTASLCPGHFMAGRYPQCWRCNASSGRWRSLQMWALTFPRRWLCRLGGIHIAPTHYLNGLLRLPRSVVIWHGVADPAAGKDSSGDASASRSLLPSHPPLFVFIGRLVSTKGVYLLLDAAAELRNKGFDFRIDLIGDGPERRHLEEKCQALGINGVVRFLGYLSPAAAEESLRVAAAVVMPPIAGEVFGLVTAENMMRGRLVIVPERGALAEVLGDAGIKFPNGDAPALANAIERVLLNPSLIQSFGERALARALAEFPLHAMIAAHAKVYRELSSQE